MVDSNVLYIVGGIVVGGGLVAWGTSVRGRTHKMNVEEPARELQRIEEILAKTTSIDTLERIYQNGHGYLNQQKQKIDVRTIGSEVIQIDPVSSLRTPSYLEDTLQAVGEMGKNLQAHYFSLSEPNHVNRFSLYGFSFHKKLE